MLAEDVVPIMLSDSAMLLELVRFYHSVSAFGSSTGTLTGASIVY